MNQKYLDGKKASEYLTDKGCKTAPTTLQKLVSVGGGPVYYKFGHKRIYTEADLDAWVESRITTPRRSSTVA